ncbi:MAG: hydantoinase/oxoprolinase family protein [Gracilibacteraceae bacterium]|jgi:N-methylhydantoinase A|nr:hydantoinase/oxoprolinase family protein [Gracilibacteraceae bacterium]
MRVATDIGGTFTDLVALARDGGMVIAKGDTTPPNFEEGVMRLLAQSGVKAEETIAFIHGTTTIINALTERKGAKTGLITTRGFRDVLEIARCNRPDLFNLVFAKPTPFIPRYLRYEVDERVAFDGSVITALSEDDVKKAVTALRRDGAEAIAICFINAYANDAHERQAAALARELWPEAFVTASYEVTREWREYERTSTIALNAYVGPVASRYIYNLEKSLDAARISCGKFFMQSNGGVTPFAAARTTPIQMVESGPVAGVFGALTLGRIIGEKQLISFDVGGTTAKCSLIDGGEVKIVTNYRIERTDRYAGYPIMAPVVDIVEIGSGGGSIAWMDDTGSLRVGPQSAGALPGPVAYGKGGTRPTTTDACLLAGRLSPHNFAGRVDLAAVEKALREEVGRPLNMDAREAAVGIIRVAEANMYNALKLVSVRRGYDPREFTLVAFGGGGPMHASSLARELGIRRVIVPVAAAVFSAWGMLMTDVRHDYLQTRIRLLSDAAAEETAALWRDLEARAAADLRAQHIGDGDAAYFYYADMRYAGQEHTVKVQTPAPPWDEAGKAEIARRFHETHEHYYTFKLEQAPIEIVNLHLAVHGRMEKPELPRLTAPRIPLMEAVKEIRSVYFTGDGFRETPIYDRDRLFAGAEITGPALVEEKDAATLVGAGQKLTVDIYGGLILETEVR